MLDRERSARYEEGRQGCKKASVIHETEAQGRQEQEERREQY
jgi:hypothetical protein